MSLNEKKTAARKRRRRARKNRAPLPRICARRPHSLCGGGVLHFGLPDSKRNGQFSRAANPAQKCRFPAAARRAAFLGIPAGVAAFPHHMQNRPERGRLRRRICRPLETTGKYESSSLPSCAAAGLRLPISRPISPNTAPISASVFTAFISIADLTLNCAANPALTPLCRWPRKSSGKIFRAFRASAP